ncbi:acyltransferase family protein [Novosphingobium sp. TH158]|uniref:acyltransferase family protein n=1 Tax=Novosphingobium sp. TH158 TaxID=2067455 RepID=UPI0013044CA3|nr:acyltransferase family protein [Novosphingobium sp. TH158]
MAEGAAAYRPEIDGLRAIAVVPVVLFHAGFQVFSGGFVGVDVFFVISGYLITGILLSDIEAGRYSIARFYERRARRILPALFLVIAASVPLAWFAMLPDELARFGKSIVAVLGFASNITFWLEEGYFSQASELKPLLHTWSLAVEEQFYIAFPLALLVLRKASRQVLIVLVALAALASLALCLYASQRYALANFYLAPTRAWELLAGSLCACIGRRPDSPFASLLSGLGLALVLLAIFWLDGSFPFPSHWALLPVVGTMLIVLYARADRGAGRLLALRPMVGIGLVSYSLYLWHQPLFAYARLLETGPMPRGTMLALSLLSGLLAWASWKWVEQPFRRRDGIGHRRKALPLAIGSAAVLAGIGTALYLTGGVPDRFQRSTDPTIAAMSTIPLEPSMQGGDCKPDPEGFVQPCQMQGSRGAPRTIAVYGDSHATALLPAFRALAAENGARLLFGSYGGCPPLLGAYMLKANSAPEVCADMARAQFEQARRERPDMVYLVGRWSLYTSGDPHIPAGRYLLADQPRPWLWTREDSRRVLEPLLLRTVDAYRAAGLKVTVIDQVPSHRFDLQRTVQWLAYRPTAEGLAEDIRASSVKVAEYRDLMSASRPAMAAVSRRGVPVLQLQEDFRQGDRYAWARPGEIWYNDMNHVSPAGAMLLLPALSASYRRDVP